MVLLKLCKFILNYRHLHLKSGLILNPYFSVFKLLWLIENVPEVAEAVNEERCMFGTIDSWLIWVKFDYFLY